jgi:hypothetical protein
MSDWQTIDTAPKDGTTIQITDGRTVYAGAWAPSIHGSKYPWAFIEVFASDPHGCCDNEDSTRIESNAFPLSGPTHWQPLAEPPRSPTPNTTLDEKERGDAA